VFLQFVAPLAFLLLQSALLMAPASVSEPSAYLLMAAAPLGAGAVTAWRARKESETPARWGWASVSLSLLLIATGATGNFVYDMVLGDATPLHVHTLLAVNLSAVPLYALLASPWREREPIMARAVSGVQALALGGLYFLVTLRLLQDSSMSAPRALAVQALLMDAQNIFVTVAAAVRWKASPHRGERALFGVLASYSTVYLILSLVNNHAIHTDPHSTLTFQSMVTLAFALLVSQAWPGARRLPSRPLTPPPGLVNFVRSASPFMLTCTLLLVSLVLIRLDYPWGTAGVLCAAGGHALRGTVLEIRQRLLDDRLQRERDRLKDQAWRDALTGIANRHFLKHTLSQISRKDRRAARTSCAVLMLDIDYFKKLNDSMGHAAGDACLRKLARSLQQSLARPDDLVVRYGGEEFLVMLRQADEDGAMMVAERLRVGVEELEMPHPGSPLGHVTVSIGVASMEDLDSQSMRAAIRRADRALYRAKLNGRNQVVLAPPALPGDATQTLSGSSLSALVSEHGAASASPSSQQAEV
jgi:diguanylate cyclase (GGDEF)-like protein